ncbi:hypothetical protein LCGC14_1934280 [marine sediment metagenome]|uniref:Uncharacterized protein n=1 Tax=marine sediment metagenome TaxID=412755 RepID=A0A0F9I0T7_9ZZZZ
MSEIETIIIQALGKASILFMSQEIKGTEIVMPTEELSRIAKLAASDIRCLEVKA